MLNALSVKIAAQAGVPALQEIVPAAGDTFGSWWTVITPGIGEEYFWFWKDVALPNGTVVKMTGGPLFVISGTALKPLQESE